MDDHEIRPERLTVYNTRNLPHWQVGGSWYFVTFRSVQGHLPECAHDLTRETIICSHQRHYDLATAVIMPDHVHLLIRPLETAPGIYITLAKIMKTLKGVSARKINVQSGTSGTVWQKESFDRIIRDGEEWVEKYEYIRGNAVKAGLAEIPHEYPWFIEGEQFINRP